MLLPREQSPWNCGYFLGAIAMQVLENQGDSDITMLQVGMSEILHRDISPTQVISAAAWLFLIDAIQLDGNGRITKCS